MRVGLMVGPERARYRQKVTQLIADAKAAEQAGFTAVSSSDHFQPWSQRQGESGFAWAWLGAAMYATSLPFSVVCAPGQRYHPAVLAQAAATLATLPSSKSKY